LTGDATIEAVRVAIATLRPAYSPRLAGEDRGHIAALVQSGTPFEPILVHRGTNRVIDGMHRLRATLLRGEQWIQVRYLDGPVEEIFIRSVEANVMHGLPLTLRDRRAAALRILGSHPCWSDRAIARATGLSPKTVGAIRRRLSAESPQSSGRRIGQDGRTRPVDPTRGRRAAVALLAERPGATLREIAEAAGISLSTAHDVRRLVRSGEDPLRTPRRGADQPGRAPLTGPRDRADILERLAKDPSLRFTDSGRLLLRWLGTLDIDTRTGRELLDAVPPHCAVAVADLAASYSELWRRFAVELVNRSCSTPSQGPNAS
jgi:DNA-binding CsgD family transcriptional regulator